MSFSIDCDCGRQISVQASQAGTTIPCDCGATLRVPRLSRLRELAGQGAYESGTIDTIQRMLNDD
jgi:hypothetical protein